MMLICRWWLIVLEVLCLAAGWFFVGGRRPYGDNALGEVSIFAFLGLVSTCGTSYVLFRHNSVPRHVSWGGSWICRGCGIIHRRFAAEG